MEGLREGPPSMQPYRGFTKGIRGTEGTKVTLQELLESERKNRMKEEVQTGPGETATNPKYEMGQRVYYFIEELGNEKWHSARVLGWSYPGEDGHPLGSDGVRYRLLPDSEKGQTYLAVERVEKSTNRMAPNP